MLAPELTRGADGWRLAVVSHLVIGNVRAGVVAITERLGNGVVRSLVVDVDPLGHQSGQEIRQ